MISAERSHFTQAENRERSDALGEALLKAGLAIRAASGRFEGVSEASYQVKVPHDRDLDVVVRLADQYSQLAVMIVDEYLTASISSNGLTPIVIGTWTKASESEALSASGYTRLGDEYFVIS